MLSKTNLIERLIEGVRNGSRSDTESKPILVPDVLTNSKKYECKYVLNDKPRAFILDAIARIQGLSKSKHYSSENAKCDQTFLIDLRSHATLDRMHGTFISLIPWLAHYACDLACKNIVLLPLGPYGQTRRKGRDGSLFSVTDHLTISENYWDSLVPEMNVDDQYAALIALAATAGIRMGMVQPLATAALDCPLFAHDPTFSFWWRADPSEVLYAPFHESWDSSALAEIIEHQRYGSAIRELITPIPKEYATRFVEPPSRSSIRIVQRDEGTYFVGKSLYKGRMVDVTIANAIPDIVPDLREKYAWRDIALFNYWRTLIPTPFMLMGCEEINKNSIAIKKMARVMPSRATKYGESVFWLDMARCLPAVVRNSAPLSTNLFKSTKIIHEQITGSAPMLNTREAVVVGEFLCEIAPFTTSNREFGDRLFRFLSKTAKHTNQLRYLSGPGTHDALPLEPRISAALMILANILPGAESLLVSGQERFVQKAINAEFGEFLENNYNENHLSLFSCTPDLAISGVSAQRLAIEYGLPTVSNLLRGPVALIREYIGCCLTDAPPKIKRDDSNKSIIHFSVGEQNNGPWCKLILRFDNDKNGRISSNENWDVVLRPLTKVGWKLKQQCPAGSIKLEPIDLLIVGGGDFKKHLAKSLVSYPRFTNTLE